MIKQKSLIAWIFATLFLAQFLVLTQADAAIYYAKDEAFKLAFPEADHFEQATYMLTEGQVRKVEELCQAKIDSKLFTFYKAYQRDKLLGFIAIDSHPVRSMQETFMAVLDAEGRQKKVVMLAFNEPEDYLASQKWLDQFISKKLDDNLVPGHGIHGIAGSTMTTNAMASGVRKVLAMYEVLVLKSYE